MGMLCWNDHKNTFFVSDLENDYSPQEAISSTIKLNDEGLVLGLLEFLQNDKKIKVCKNMTSTNDAIVFADL